MKITRVLTVVLVVAVFGLFAFQGLNLVRQADAAGVWTKKVIDGATIAASGSTTSEAIDLRDKAHLGYFSNYYEVSGSGTAKIEFLMSVDCVNYLEPSGSADIETGITKTSGPGSDGKDISGFSPSFAKCMKIKATETAGSFSVTISDYLMIQ